MLTPKQPVINAVLITYIYYPITENYIGEMASFLPYTCPEPLLKFLHHIYLHFLWHSCNFFANGNFQIVDCTRFSTVDFWFEVTPKKEIASLSRLLPISKICVPFAPPCIILLRFHIGANIKLDVSPINKFFCNHPLTYYCLKSTGPLNARYLLFIKNCVNGYRWILRRELTINLLFYFA